ncbi:hypothetical protein PV328_000464 [Microctonus aethiopoides]|uniref:AAA+ ATPase domain-containing protein n=1 Tax=Microctonus aethiopoides TaxID=144406 RepID=A0AA39FUY4_9HYME|nr:hypothetical protein PV328_000464 [Microctonus aethiopoides]
MFNKSPKRGSKCYPNSPKPKTRKIQVTPKQEEILPKKEERPEIVDQLKLIEKLGQQSDGQFYYMIYAVGRSLSSVFFDYSFMDATIVQNLTLFDFSELQLGKLENVRRKLDKLREDVTNITYEACIKALHEVGYTIDDSNITIDQTAYGKLGRLATEFEMPNDDFLQMSFIEQVSKREKCRRLSCFLHLIDYIIVVVMRDLLGNTYSEFMTILEGHTNFLPSKDQLSNPGMDIVIEDPRPNNSPYKTPYFNVDVILSNEGKIVLDPSNDVFQHVISTVRKMWEENLDGIKPLLLDSRFQCFTRPMINREIEKYRLCGDPPQILVIVKNDPIIQEYIKQVEELLKLNMSRVRYYCQRFINIEEFYNEDKKLNRDVIQKNEKCDIFRQWCSRYNEEEEKIEEIINFQPIGIFNLMLQRFKAEAIIALKEKRNIINSTVPEIGSKKVNELLSDALEAISYLGSEPSTTEDFVSYITFVDKSQQRVENMDARLDYIKEIYDIMEEYHIPIPAEDFANYLKISVELTSLRSTVEKRHEERQKLISKFNEHLENDIKNLIEDISLINNQATEFWLIAADSNAENCLETLRNLTKKMENLTQQANTYQGHQKNFKLEVIRLDILDQVTNELRLRSLLWESVDSWAAAVKTWYNCDFNSLNVEEMTNMTVRYAKYINQLEKGLMKNDIVPKLKEDIELIRDKLPIISYLRNPDLKSRHWIKIQSLLNYKFTPETCVTLSLLESLGAFIHPEELMEIAAAATSEANLENMLNKVQTMWKSLEFIVLPHKESSDIFVLGSLEEIQAALDESYIIVQTIAASRHVTPIKPRLDEWIKQLELFAMTMDAWQYCQQQWMYLEAIFTAPDIQRQLPLEAKLFIKIDKVWKDIMRKTAKMPLAMVSCTQPGLLEQLQENNKNLDEIIKCLEAYLDTKRIAFPRFFFLSNDELLEILAQTRNPHAVQRHLQKCFDAIYRLEFGAAAAPEASEKTSAVLTTDILAMISPEGERVSLGKGLKARGNVENWLSKVEESMFISLRRRMKAAIGDLETRGRQEFIATHPSQIVLTVSQILWVRNVHHILEDAPNTDIAMRTFEQKCYSDLNQLAGMVRTELPPLIRDVIINLITIDVHARDIVTSLIDHEVSSSFEWIKNLRYYWEQEVDNCLTRMSNAEYLYGYEYLGAQRRLVITPLTDKCYLCLMGALQLNLGGAPAGPAGTGKTETTKDLAKALAIQCVVFNCSEGLDFRMMGRFFSGLATSGAWCCFDEFNRIDIEVLSVIAQQLITIKNAKAARANEFMFEGRVIKLVMSCATFVTMNPGYAGRTELPDNLKSLFRPIAMMVPDYRLIAEVILYSEGFESSKQLSIKMTLMYTLCSEQLSQQDHYDFGMRAVKTVLVMAGSLKRENLDKNEEIVLIKALRDSNLPKFLSDDADLFLAILADLFPNIEIPDDPHGIFEETIVSIMTEAKLQPENSSIRKIIQFHETLRVRHGVMLVGPTGAGKTTILRTLCDTYTRLHEIKVPGQFNKRVNMYVLNPKAITMSELYGEVDIFSNEWRDGLLGAIIRSACSADTDDHQWVVCDGPVDALWIENMNTVLDDNKMLCLANSERIKFTPYVHMIFEVMDLAQASPATVSRCGMVYVDSSELGWMPYVKTWLSKLPDNLQNPEITNLILKLFNDYVEDGLAFFKKSCDHAISQVDISKVNMVCSLLESILIEPGAINKNLEKSRLSVFIVQSFIFSYIWGIGGNIIDESREIFDVFVSNQFEKNPDAKLPSSGELWNLFMNVQSRRMDLWIKLMPPFTYDGHQPFFEILVPTIDTVRFGYIIEKMINVKKPVFITGATGVGKSAIVKVVLNSLRESGLWVPVTFNFSAQTTSKRIQDIIELKFEKRKRTLLTPPIGKRVCVFVDDVNMPRLDTYGSQPPIELLRQVLDFGGFYDRDKLFWKTIEDMVLTTACAPPGGGRNPMSPRFMRHFGMLVIPTPTETSLRAIFKSIVHGFLAFNEFSQSVSEIGDQIVNATVDIYNRIATDLLPTPEKSHYIFNLRDLSKCIQGIMQSDPSSTRNIKQMLRLFYHECLRVFHDRLIDDNDKNYFYQLLSQICSRTFGDEVISVSSNNTVEPPQLFFGDFMQFGAPMESRIYEEITNIEKMKTILQDYLDDYCMIAKKEMKLIFFMHAIQHLCRLARILRSERGHGLLVGVGGMGKQSLTRLASHLNGYPCWQIEVIRGYDINSWHADLRTFYFKSGAYAEDTTFLFTDTQIVTEEFLEDINNTLNSGEVPNLYEDDELEKAIIATRPAAKSAGILEGNRDEIYEYFISRVRNHLHLVLCMSPAGDALRFWPNDALLSVAQTFIVPSITDDINKATPLVSVCVLMHESVEDMTKRYFMEMGRRFYTTPSSYLELLKLYSITLERKTKEIISLRSKINNGLNKLYETREMVATMKKELIVLAPELKTSSEEVTKLMKVVVKQQGECDKVRAIVADDEAIAKAKADETAVLEAEARKDLEAVMPALEEAQRALESLNKNDINEIRVFNKPPHLVRYVMEAVCLLLGTKTDWPAAKLVLSDVHFLDRLINYPKDNINEKLLKKLQVYINNPEFVPNLVAKQSKVCKSICIWVRAIDGYAKIFRVVEPKRIKLQHAQDELKTIQNVVDTKQKELLDVENKISQLQKQYDTALKHLKQLESSIALSEARLSRSGRLITALSDEQERWEELMKGFENKITNLIGDCLIAAGALAYLGAFTQLYRQNLFDMWLEKCNSENITITENFSLIGALADPYQVRIWNTFGLPRDQVSTENALLVTQARRWPLMIDPQEQAYRWIRNMESVNNIKFCEMTDSNLMRTVESCIRLGLPILLYNVGEVLDPSLEPVLLQHTFVQGGRLVIRIGNTDIEYEQGFKLYITTKIANPHYLPEICIKVTIVNFTVTPSGLEDQLLALESPDLEKIRDDLVTAINSDKIQLQKLEDKILSMLYSWSGNILDNEELIESLNNSKETSAIIATRLIDSEKTEEKILIQREVYRSVATRGSILFFVIAKTSTKSRNIETRLQILYEEITLSIYLNVSRGLFEKHKLVLSFMFNLAIRMNNKTITSSQWNFILRGPGKIETTKKPNYSTLSDLMWKSVNYLDENFPNFAGISKDALKKIKLTLGYMEEEINVLPDNNENATKDWNNLLDDMEKLMLIKSLREDKLIFGITAFIKNDLGKSFVEPDVISLSEIFQNTSNSTPLIFVLSTGSDPFGAFIKFANEMGSADKCNSISLGQGQGPIAENLIKDGCTKGHWIFLQNCHLATSWMSTLEHLVTNISESENIHTDFRLILSSMPSSTFPISILENAVKVTSEPPKGIKANMKRILFDINQNFFEENDLDTNWRMMIFGICFFHSIIQERKKFGPLGWNILYDFTDNDRECCLLNMKMFCEHGKISWNALTYTTGEITYGGRITDNWDLRCLKTILDNFFSPKTLEEDYIYSPSGIYYPPRFQTLQEYINFVETFPLMEEPEIFGMHENANVTYRLKETQNVINTILDIQPKIDAGVEEKSKSNMVYEAAQMIMDRIALEIDPDQCNPNHYKKDSAGRLPSLTTVLLHEVDRYNKLLMKIHVSMENLQRAIKGFVVMSDELESVFNSLMNNQVPKLWHNVNVYPSLKSLGLWIRDLELRTDFIKTWLMNEQPISFWISGLSFPQGFITGVLQTHARRYNIPIDFLKIDYEITNTILNQEEIESIHVTSKKESPELYNNLSTPNDGVFIHGLYIDAGKWDFDFMVLVDASIGELNPPLPIVHIIPVLNLPEDDQRYVCPLYKTGIRAGVLSTTGHSTNFVISVLLPSSRTQSYWILKGTALLIQITN